MKKLNIEISGKEFTLNFGANWFIEHFRNESGIDLIKDAAMITVDVQSVDFFKVLQSFIYAGYLTECSIKRTDPELKKDDFIAHVMGLDEQGAIELFFQALSAMAGITVEQFKSLTAETEEKKSLI